MTKEEAKQLSLEVWFYLRNHPEIYDKCDLPEDLWSQIENMESECPLCEYFKLKDCRECPLRVASEVMCANGYYEDWKWATNDLDREFYAGEIYKMISAW